MAKYTTSQNISPIQPICKKRTYHTLAEADDMIKHIAETRITRGIRAYHCLVCGFWHLTSRSGK